MDEEREVPLTKQDIINIADIEYDLGVGENSAVIFHVVDRNELLRRCTSQLLNKNKFLVYIVDLGSFHWVTLVIVYRDEQFFAYYIDPLGKKVDDYLKNCLKERNIYCPNIVFWQTDFNTGIFALKNLEVIFTWNQSTQKFEQRPSFSEGIGLTLKGMVEPKNGINGLKGEINKNKNKYVTISTDSYGDLKTQLGSLCSQLKTDKKCVTTFIIPSVLIFTVGFRDEQVVACYVANDSTYESDIKNLLSQKGIILIFVRNDIRTRLPEFNNNMELCILQSAKVVTNYFKIKDYITLAKEELDKVSKKGIEGIINRLKARKKIEAKIVRCESVIDKYNKQYKKQINEDSEDFTTAQCNILILFLESIALQDAKLSNSLGEKLVRIRERIMGQEDFNVIDKIRSKYLVHRSDSNSNINTIIECGDINNFCNIGVNRVEFFETLQIYLKQIIDKLNRNDVSQEIRVTSFLKTEGTISNKVKTEEEIKDYLSDSFTKLVNTNSYSSEHIQMIMFELVVNVIPLLEGLYSDKKNDKVKKLEIDELRNIQIEKNELLHNFHKYESERVRKFELKKFIDKIKPTFFKYVYSQKIYNLLKELSKDTIEQKLNKSLEQLLKDFNYDADEFGDQNQAVTIQSIASMLEPSKPLENSLTNFISNYVKLMYFIDNEDEIQRRKEKYPSLPQRYDQRSDMRLYVYEHFNLLKQVYSNRSHEYKLIEVQFAKELKKKCGILKPLFESMVKSYVKGENNIDLNELIKLTGNVSKIIEKDKNRKISDIIELYGKRESLQAEKRSINEKFKSIPKGEKVNINGVVVSTDRFVVNILELFDSISSQYKNIFNNVEEAFSDETFLSFLSHNNINFSEEIWNKLLEIKDLSPYIVELIVRDQLNDQSGLIISEHAFNGIIENLLGSNLRVVHLKKLLKISDDELLAILDKNNESLNRKNIYTQVCEIITKDNVSNLYQLLEDEVHAIEILNLLSNIIIPESSNNLNQETIDLIKSTLDLLDRVSEKLIYKKDYESLHKILNSAGAEKLVRTLLQIDNTDLYALKICRRRAVIENEKAKQYDTAKRILEDIKDRIQLNGQEDTQSFYLLVSSDLAYTKHLKEEYKEAYEEYEVLYEEMIILSLNPIVPCSKFSLVDTYNEVMMSKKYVSILKYSPKYLDILKIRSDMAYELRSYALSKEPQDEALKSYEDALKIYKEVEEVYKIKAKDSVLGQDSVKNMRDIAYVNNKLAKLKLSSLKLGEALSHYEEALTMYSEVLEIQKREQWETHPANSKTKQDINQARRNVAYVNNKLGLSKSEEALEHHKKALESYQKVYEFQKDTLGQEHNYTLNTKKNVSYTHNQLAHLYEKVGNKQEAILHCRENLVLLEVNSEEYRKANSFLKKLTLDVQTPTLN